MSRLFSGTAFDRPRLCERCGKAPADCRCMALPPKKKMSGEKGAGGAKSSAYELTPENSSPPADQVARVRIEKRKGNRFVTVIAGLDHPANDLGKLCTELKESLGTGGSVQGRTVELQGDLAEKALELLTARKLKARMA